MNTLIDFVNASGERLGDAALSLFLQSTLLIALVWCADLALRRKLRASVRYALWLVVLVKLVTPPSLAVPSGLGWWLRETSVAQPAIRQMQITATDAVATPARGTTTSVPAVRHDPSISGAGWCALISLAISLGLLAWMISRWRHVGRLVERAGEATELLTGLLEQARGTSGIRGRVSLRLTDRSMSPAVCGLMRPVILLPRSLAEQLPDAQLKAVLLHELMHLRRGDVWVNCAQALIQIVFWWHPLLWLANARIRSLREEAVDDAVMLALDDKAESYAPTLLEVAKFALDRPLASLGLVGILESRSALRQRIERLLVFSAPRKAGLTILSIIGVVAFAAVAVPMGPATSQVNGELAAIAPDSFEYITSHMPNNSIRSNLPTTPTALDDFSTNPVPDQLVVEVKFVEIGNFDSSREPEGSPLRLLPKDSLTNAGASKVADELRAKFVQPENLRLDSFSSEGKSAILTCDQAKSLIKRIQQTSGSDIMSGPKLTTLSGRPCRIGVQDATNLVSGVLTNEQNPHYKGENCVGYLTTQVYTGPVVEFHQKIASDKHTIQMSVTGNVIEFQGYDKPPHAEIRRAGKPPLAYTIPLPRVRLISAASDASVPDGQTLMIAGPAYYDTVKMKDKVPGLGDMPLVGGLFRHESTSQIKKNLIILVTPTLIDAAGNRLYPESK